MPAKIPCYCHVSPASEREMHRTLAGFLRVALPPDWLFNHQPNEGKRGWVAQRDLGDMGVVTGWPDLQIVGPGGRAYWLELKMPKGQVSPAQKEVGEKLRILGCNYAVARTYDEAEAAMLGWGIPLTATFGRYVAAWTSLSRLTAEEFARFIIAAAPPKPPPKPPKASQKGPVVKAVKATRTAKTSKTIKPKGKTNGTVQSASGKRRAA